MKITANSFMLGGLFSLLMQPVQADTMDELLKLLFDQGTLTEQHYQQLQALRQQEVGSPTSVKVSEQRIQLDEHGLRFNSTDRAFSSQIGGRLHTDYAAIEDDRNLAGNGSRIRNARLGIQGKVFTDWLYKSEFDFAGNTVNATDLFIGYEGWNNRRLIVGRHKMPSGLELLTGIGNITFMERSIASNMFSVNRQNGISISHAGNNWSWSAASWLDGVSANNRGKNEDYGYATRISFAPVSINEQHLHLGSSFSHQQYHKSSDDNLSRDYAEQLLTASPEISLITSPPVQSRFQQVKHSNTYGLEAAYIQGPWSIQSEYFQQQLKHQPRQSRLSGWYLFGTYSLTGESRGYDSNTGRINGIKPTLNATEGGYGAWELALRFSEIDLVGNNHAVINPAAGDQGQIWTLGLNWYANQNIRLMANYNHAQIKKTGQSDFDIQAIQLRGQIAF